MLTRFIFDEDIVVEPLLFFLIIGHINYKTNIVIYGRDCQNNDIEPLWFLLVFCLMMIYNVTKGKKDLTSTMRVTFYY